MRFGHGVSELPTISSYWDVSFKSCYSIEVEKIDVVQKAVRIGGDSMSLSLLGSEG